MSVALKIRTTGTNVEENSLRILFAELEDFWVRMVSVHFEPDCDHTVSTRELLHEFEILPYEDAGSNARIGHDLEIPLISVFQRQKGATGLVRIFLHFQYMFFEAFVILDI